MRFSLTTWNINSVRLRMDLVARFLKSARPDILCLQETKCIDDAFPLKRFRRLGYQHIALNGQKGYHGVAVVSKLPFESTGIRTFCDRIDSRHITVAFGAAAKSQADANDTTARVGGRLAPVTTRPEPRCSGRRSG